MTARRLSPARTAATAAAVTAALVLTACGGTDDAEPSRHAGHGSAPSASAPSVSAPATAGQGAHNAADVAFAQGMIPHHRQAVEMADMARDRASATEVKELAAAIKKAQDPEIRTLSGWLTTWGERVPGEDASAGHSAHTGHGDGMTGMMTEQEMEQLERSSGRAFDTAFLKLMVKHHEGAVAMARTEQGKGSYPPAKAMAGDIVASQSAEIARMKKLLGTD
ncbi:DUF305 domain-containing protein [Streptomyces lavendofoliae]|uniref:DUF305 domain-containing protein n=1 Tax=Streptomyces lavendofoliae TaxID=67314 RepID=UPI003D8F87F4